ncbi:MAG: hypothetical protein ABIQ75_02465 [Flavobacteriales bacterium]
MVKPILPLFLVAGLLMSCGGSDHDGDDTASSGTTTAITTDDGAGTANSNTDMNGTRDASTTATDRYNATGQMDPMGNYTSDGTLRPGVVITPVEERTDAVARMNGIRATLMAELEEVRTHLKDGTLDKEHATADQERAADLAQGLERVDRTLAAMGNATDATWAEMRAAQLKEVDEVRTWWNAHMAERNSMAKR